MATYGECIDLFFQDLDFHFLRPLYPPNNNYMVVALRDDLEDLNIQQIVSLNCYIPNSVDLELMCLYPSLPRRAFHDAIGNRVIFERGKHMRDLYFDVLGWEPHYSLSDRQPFIQPEHVEKVYHLYQSWISENGERAYALHLDTHHTKMWAIEEWIEVVSHIWRRWKAWPMVLGKETESSHRLQQTFAFARKLSSEAMVIHVAAVKLLKVFVGVDSIFAHVADSYSKHMVVLYGPTDLRVWGPLSPQAWIVRTDGDAHLKNISADNVIRNVDRAFESAYGNWI
jgi:ADP-heptose:LPS heptosyltransferase